MLVVKTQPETISEMLNEIFDVYTSVREYSVVKLVKHVEGINKPKPMVEACVSHSYLEKDSYAGIECIKRNRMYRVEEEELLAFDAYVGLREHFNDYKIISNVAKGRSPYHSIYRFGEDVFGIIPYNAAIIANIIEHNTLDKKWFIDTRLNVGAHTVIPVISSSNKLKKENILSLPVDGPFYWAKVEARVDKTDKEVVNCKIEEVRKA